MPEQLVQIDWLQAHFHDPGLRIIDARASDPRLAVGYRMGHIPGAIPLDVGRDLYTMETGRPQLKPPEAIAVLLGQRGVSEEDTVVLYDEGTGPLAAYVFWLLTYLGHRDVRVLNGGWQAWRAASGLTTRDRAEFPPEEYTVRLDPESRVQADWILQRQGDPGWVLLDVRSDGEYEMGHIPGAVNLSFDNAIDPLTQQLKPPEQLRRQFEGVGATPDQEVVAYCASGARSAHTFMVLKLLGFPHVRHYDGSMMDWFQVRRLPLE